MTASPITQTNSAERTTTATHLRRPASEELLASVTHYVARADLAGFEFPVALSHPVWTRYLQQGSSVDEAAAHLWDILMVLGYEMMRSCDPTEIKFSVRVPNEGRTSEPVPLRALWSTGENGRPVLTILLQD